jgi:ZIP family zinc transporter
MTEIAHVLLLSLAAGITIPIGAHLAFVFQSHRAWLSSTARHGIIAFGGGVLLSAVSLVLVPEGVALVPLGYTVVAFILGGLCFCVLDRVLARRAGAVGQVMAMIVDFIPEALAMGATLASGEPVGLVLALLIATQNLPEGFNAFAQAASQTGVRVKRVLAAFWAMVLLGPLCGIAGFYLLADNPHALGTIMLFAAAGIIYLTFEDIAPAVPIDQSWLPPLGAVAGFLAGLVGHLVLG